MTRRCLKARASSCGNNRTTTLSLFVECDEGYIIIIYFRLLFPRIYISAKIMRIMFH